MNEQRLTRNERDKMIAGVCAGIADYLAIDPVLVRLAFLLLIPSGGIGIPLYIALMIIMPSRDNVGKPSSEVLEENIEEFGETLASGVDRFGRHPQGPILTAGILIFFGAYLLLRNLGWFSLNLGLIGPLLLVALGIYLLSVKRKS